MTIRPVIHPQQLKVLGDIQRLAILRRLMVRPATLSQLGEFFQASPAHIRHHIKALEEAGFVELDSTQQVRNLIEKYYRASASAYLLNLLVLPELPPGQVPLVIASNDIALQRLQAGFSGSGSGVEPLVLSMDSLQGLVGLREGLCQVSACHLLDAASAEYNRPFVRHLFPGQTMALIHMFQREEGLLVHSGNPRQIHRLEDLAQAGVKMVNRERGSGIRVWLDYQLHLLGISPDHLNGYQVEVASHAEVGRAVFEGRADAGLGLKTCTEDFDLQFIPLFEEPYDLVLTQETLADTHLSPVFERLASSAFRQAVGNICGYHVPGDSGRIDLIS